MPETSILNESQARMHARLQEDLPFAAEMCARVTRKEGGDLAPLTFKRAQMELHRRIEDQKRRTGRVRMMILKGRQMGISTYIEWRFYWNGTRRKGVNTFILSHESATTDKLFNMAKRYHDNLPAPVQPQLRKSNMRELAFADLESSYSVGTAGNDKIGVGGTVQQLHGSEVALWGSGDKEIIAGLLQSVGMVDGTEILMESTARGMGNKFELMCMDAIKGESEYEFVFLPWFWDDDYRAKPPKDFDRTSEEREIAALYGLDDEQLYWRRLKIAEFSGDIWMFRREYPLNYMEAFMTSGDGLIDPAMVIRARKRPVVNMNWCPTIVGVDPNGCGKKADRAIIAWRRGKAFLKYSKYGAMDPMELTGILARILAGGDCDAMFIDYAHGFAVYSRLVELGWGRFVFPVNFSSGAIAGDRFANKRAEILTAVYDWISDDDCSVPDDDELHTDFVIMPKPKEDSNNRKLYPKKAEIKAKYGISPDIYDAFALTFAAPVKKREQIDQRNGLTGSDSNAIGGQRRKSSLSTVNYVNGVNSSINGGGGPIYPANWIGRG